MTVWVGLFGVATMTCGVFWLRTGMKVLLSCCCSVAQWAFCTCDKSAQQQTREGCPQQHSAAMCNGTLPCPAFVPACGLYAPYSDSGGDMCVCGSLVCVCIRVCSQTCMFDAIFCCAVVK
jgi:hypothetical protein